MKPRPLIWTPQGWEPAIYVCKHIARASARKATIAAATEKGLYSENADFICDKCNVKSRNVCLEEVPQSVARNLVAGILDCVAEE